MCYLIEVTYWKDCPIQRCYTYNKNLCLAALEEAVFAGYYKVDILDAVTGEVLANFYDEEIQYNEISYFDQFLNNFRFQI